MQANGLNHTPVAAIGHFPPLGVDKPSGDAPAP